MDPHSGAEEKCSTKKKQEEETGFSEQEEVYETIKFQNHTNELDCKKTIVTPTSFARNRANPEISTLRP